MMASADAKGSYYSQIPTHRRNYREQQFRPLVAIGSARAAKLELSSEFPIHMS